MIYTSPACAQCGVAVLQEPLAFTANKSPEKRIVDTQFSVSNQHSVCWTGKHETIVQITQKRNRVNQQRI